MAITRSQMTRQLEPGLGNRDLKSLKSDKKDAWNRL
jgi:hypothetical protein